MNVVKMLNVDKEGVCCICLNSVDTSRYIKHWISDEESKSHKQASTKRSKAVSSNWHVISSSDEGALKKLSPFAIQKGLIGYKILKWVTVDRVFDGETLQMSSQVDFTRQCFNQCHHIPPLIHQRVLSDVETWKALVMKKFLKTFHYRRQENKGPF